MLHVDKQEDVKKLKEKLKGINDSAVKKRLLKQLEDKQKTVSK